MKKPYDTNFTGLKSYFYGFSNSVFFLFFNLRYKRWEINIKNGGSKGVNSTIRRYQAVDLMIWSIILFVFEFIVVKAGSVWFRAQLWTLSIVPALVAVVYMRWSAFGVLYSALGGIALCFASGASTQQYLIYTLGNLFSVVLLLFLKFIGKEKIRDSVFTSIIFALASALSMQIGRGVVAALLGNGIGSIVTFIATDIISELFAILIICITRKLDGVFEDQISYLVRVNNEENEKGGRE